MTEAGKKRYLNRSVSGLSKKEQDDNKSILYMSTKNRTKSDLRKHNEAWNRFTASKEFKDAVRDAKNTEYIKISAKEENLFQNSDSEEYKKFEKKAIEKIKKECKEDISEALKDYPQYSNNIDGLIKDLNGRYWDTSRYVSDMAAEHYTSKAGMTREKFTDEWYDFYENTTKKMAKALSEFTGEMVEQHSAVSDSMYWNVYTEAVSELIDKKKA